MQVTSLLSKHGDNKSADHNPEEVLRGSLRPSSPGIADRIPEETLREHFLHDIGDDEEFTLRKAYYAFLHLEQQMQQSPTGERRGIVGMKDFVRGALICVITAGHMLVRGVPGLGKTYTIIVLASLLGLVFRRIQSTPDLMPSDILYRDFLEIDPKTNLQSIKCNFGPVFANFVLDDEIDRATPKTQAALLEVMQEKKVSILGRGRFPARPRRSESDRQLIDEEDEIKNGRTYFGRKRIEVEDMDESAFFVFATQNGIEQEGTYPLPEAQQDRFLRNDLVDDLPHDEQEQLMAHAFVSKNGGVDTKRFLKHHLKTLYFLVKVKEMLLSDDVRQSFWGTRVAQGIVDLRECTHLTPMIDGGQKTTKGKEVWRRVEQSDKPHLRAVHALMQRKRDDPNRMPRVELGSSPRGLFGLIRAAHAVALLEGSFTDDNHVKVMWRHVRMVAPTVLRHRIKLDHADAHRFSADDAITKLLNCFKDEYFDEA